MERIPVMVPAAMAIDAGRRDVPPMELQGMGRHPSPDGVAALWAGLYRLAIRLGWTWDGERWRDAQGAPISESERSSTCQT